MKKDKRTLKVCEQSGYNHKPTPAIMLKGAWLEDWGFTKNTLVTVLYENGKLGITKSTSEVIVND